AASCTDCEGRRGGMRSGDGRYDAGQRIAAKRRAPGISRRVYSHKVHAGIPRNRIGPIRPIGPMTFLQGFVIFTTALIAGMINSVAGGGTLVMFPTLLWIGVNPISANVTCTVALWPGSLGAMVGFRRELVGSSNWMLVFGLPSVLGGLVGAHLLLLTPERLFSSIV